MRRLLIALAVVFCSVASCQAWTHGNAGATGNTFSPLGTNLLEIGANSTEQPFLNLWKSMGSWQTANNTNPDTRDENALYTNCVDANHYLNVSPATCATNFGTTFTFLRAFFLSFLPSTYNYPAGNFVLLWDGNSNATFQNSISGIFDAATFTSCPVSGHPNRIIVAANSPNSGLEIDQTSIGTGGSYPTNFRFVYSPDSTCSVIGTREALLNSGEIFDPNFISKVSWARAIRLMKWGGSIVINTETTWSARAQTSWVSWNEDGGFGGVPVVAVPWEVGIALANKLGADLWISTPCAANPAYSQNLAALTFSTLNSQSWVYDERCNEVWNTGAFSPAVVSLVGALGLAEFPQSVDFFQESVYYAIQAGIDDCAAWKSAFGSSSSRVKCVYGLQTGFSGQNQTLLETTTPFLGGGSWTGQAYTHFDMVADAPYIGAADPSAWTADADGGLTKFFQQANSGLLPDPAGAVTTTGTSTAYVISTGQSLPATPSNATAIPAKFHVANGATSGVSMASASPAVVTWTGSALVAGTAVSFAPITAVFTGSISNGSGGAGTVLNISSIASGSIGVGTTIVGQSIAGGTTVTACPGGGCGITGNYTVNNSQNVASETMNGNNTLYTGITAGTFYWVSTAGLTANSFQFADTLAHALAGTNSVATSGTQSTPIITGNAYPTLAADGGNVFPILNDDGTVPAVSTFGGNTTPWTVVFTNATSAGAVTAGWRLLTGTGFESLGLGPALPDPLGDLHTSLTFAASDLADAQMFGLGLTSYEGAWAYASYCRTPSSTCVINNLYDNAALDSRSYTLFQTYFNSLKSQGNMANVFIQFTDISPQGFDGESWGNLLSWQQTPNPPRFQSELDWIAANHCTACGHH